MKELDELLIDLLGKKKIIEEVCVFGVLDVIKECVCNKVIMLVELSCIVVLWI